MGQQKITEMSARTRWKGAQRVYGSSFDVDTRQKVNDYDKFHRTVSLDVEYAKMNAEMGQSGGKDDLSR